MAKKQSQRERPDIYVGTSGWTYDDWQGRFYPEDVKGADRLRYYAEQFDTVEVNASFYRLPAQNMIKAWNRRLPEGFHLVLKGSRLITHQKKLRDCEEPLERFFDRAGQLERLALVLWQLPPSQHKDVDKLEAFLSELPSKPRHAVEFRHASWWDDDVAEVLSRHRAAFVAISHPDLPEEAPTTADFLYVRMHGKGEELYKYNYSEEELTEWAEWLKSRLSGRSLYVFFNNDYQAHAPDNARRLRELLTG